MGPSEQFLQNKVQHTRDLVDALYEAGPKENLITHLQLKCKTVEPQILKNKWWMEMLLPNYQLTLQSISMQEQKNRGGLKTLFLRWQNGSCSRICAGNTALACIVCDWAQTGRVTSFLSKQETVTATTITNLLLQYVNIYRLHQVENTGAKYENMHFSWYGFINPTLVFNKLFALENLSITLQGSSKKKQKF